MTQDKTKQIEEVLEELNEKIEEKGRHTEYYKADRIKRQGFIGNITKKLIAGQGFGESIKGGVSETLKAKATGIKEKFDPISIAQRFTGDIGGALVGRATGRSQKDLQYFLGGYRRDEEESNGEKVGSVDTKFFKSVLSDKTKITNKSVTILKKLIAFMEKSHEEKVTSYELANDFEEEAHANKKRRNEKLIEEIEKAKTIPEKEEIEEKKPVEPTKKPAEPTAPKPAAPTAPKPAEPTAPKPAAPTAPKPTAKPAGAPKAPEKPVTPPKVKEPTAAPVTARPTAPGVATTATKIAATGIKGTVVTALAAAGFSKAAQANILANVDEESKFVPRSEELEKYSAKTLFRLYGPPGVQGGQDAGGKNKIRFQTIADAQTVVSKGPEAVGDVIYGGRMGNNQPGDGYKYRGRGFIQITGKDAYKAIGDKIGVDLINKPDLANDPEIAAKIVPAFFQLKLGKNKPSDLDDIKTVNKLVGSASEASKSKRIELASQYMNSDLSTGQKLSNSSVKNQDLKEESTSKPVVLINNNKTNIISGGNSSQVVTQPTNSDVKPLFMAN
jgi:predicted chitinase